MLTPNIPPHLLNISHYTIGIEKTQYILFYISILYANGIEQNKQNCSSSPINLGHSRRQNISISGDINGDSTYNRIRETDLVVDTVAIERNTRSVAA